MSIQVEKYVDTLIPLKKLHFILEIWKHGSFLKYPNIIKPMGKINIDFWND